MNELKLEGIVREIVRAKRGDKVSDAIVRAGFEADERTVNDAVQIAYDYGYGIVRDASGEPYIIK